MEKSNINNLELGDIIFNSNTTQKYICPDYINALLNDLGERIEQVIGDNPFQNTAAKFKTETFEVEAYNWDESVEQPYNFKYKEIEISWYKYLWRDTTINGRYSPNRIVEMYNDCVKAINKWELENEKVWHKEEDCVRF